jgi:hypothetical protein
MMKFRFESALMLPVDPFAVVAICSETTRVRAGVRSLLRTPPVTCRLPPSVKTSRSVLARKKELALSTMTPTVCCWPSASVIIAHPEILELIIRLALRNHVNIDALGIGIQAECLSDLICCSI